MTIGERIREARKKRGLLQSKLAELLGVAENTVSSWEIGARVPSVKNIREIAIILSCSTDYLLDVTDRLE